MSEPREITAGDVLAAVDVLKALVEQVDDVPDMDTAGPLYQAVLAAKKQVGDALSLLSTRMTKLVDGQPVQVGDFVYMAKANNAWRFDHDAILAAARRLALENAYTEDGEIDPGLAVQHFERHVRALYISPSVTAKVGGLAGLHAFDDDKGKVDKRRAGEFEYKGKKLEVEDVVGE